MVCPPARSLSLYLSYDNVKQLGPLPVSPSRVEYLWFSYLLCEVYGERCYNDNIQLPPPPLPRPI